MSMSLDAACQAMGEAMRETVKRHSLWYLIEAAAHNVIKALLHRG
jgi:hypothetical protein